MIDRLRLSTDYGAAYSEAEEEHQISHLLLFILFVLQQLPFLAKFPQNSFHLKFACLYLIAIANL